QEQPPGDDLQDSADGDESDNNSVYELEGRELLKSLEREVKTAYSELLPARDCCAWVEAERTL
ncbi:hypothetical protein K466DRAFT_452510, partial [Polyporus arcularius HHB13444]